MRLISHKDRRIVKYVHVYKNLEGISYNYEYYPQSCSPQLTDWQTSYLLEAIQYDAKQQELEIRH